jgi:SAM-dependent methyltransferase
MAFRPRPIPGNPNLLDITFEPGELQQDPEEWAWMLGFVKGARSILEIGCGHGASMEAMAEVAAPGAKLRAIDFSRNRLLVYAFQRLSEAGFDARRMRADSHDPAALEFARRDAPYDFVFIDGDHSDAGVRQDWRWYGPMGRTVAFHDIAGRSEQVAGLWKEIKAAHEVAEISLRPGYVGIGVVRPTGVIVRAQHDAH